ncbi:hypothetical protein J4Q44_G00301670 [Coregonus suidteri]|uniref:Secreted protein n=1 Tax=Coregonus suidteri TaxID=861788 RepID=A0AAN8QR32_9TELE
MLYLLVALNQVHLWHAATIVASELGNAMSCPPMSLQIVLGGEQRKRGPSGLEHYRLKSLNPVSLPGHAAKLVFNSEPFLLSCFHVCWSHLLCKLN